MTPHEIVFDPHVSNALVALGFALLILLGLATWIASEKKAKR